MQLPPVEPPVIETFTPSRRFAASARYFISFAAFAALAPYLVLYYESLGFSGSQIGILLSISPLIGLVATPFWTGLADATGKHKWILGGGMLIAIIANFTIPFLRSFALILAMVTAAAFLTSHVYSLLDSSTVHMLGSQRERYGRIRLWGTIGWGVSAPIVGRILDNNPLVWIFWIYCGLMTLNLFLVRNVEFERKTEKSTPYRQGIRTLLSNRHWLLFLLAVFIAQVGMSPHGSYLSLLLQQMGANPSFQGLTILLATLFEVPVMFFSGALLKRFGNRGSLFIAMAVIGVRNLLYAFASSPAEVLAIQALHGFTFPIMWVAGVSYAAESAPPGLSATAQGLFATVVMGFAAAAGNLMAGAALDQFGIVGMYRVVGSVVLLSLLVFIFTERRVLAVRSA
jgi:PPP family 3-phenylpropionic acid transporter